MAMSSVAAAASVGDSVGAPGVEDADGIEDEVVVDRLDDVDGRDAVDAAGAAAAGTRGSGAKAVVGAADGEEAARTYVAESARSEATLGFVGAEDVGDEEVVAVPLALHNDVVVAADDDAEDFSPAAACSDSDRIVNDNDGNGDVDRIVEQEEEEEEEEEQEEEEDEDEDRMDSDDENSSSVDLDEVAAAGKKVVRASRRYRRHHRRATVPVDELSALAAPTDAASLDAAAVRGVEPALVDSADVAPVGSAQSFASAAAAAVESAATAALGGDAVAAAAAAHATVAAPSAEGLPRVVGEPPLTLQHDFVSANDAAVASDGELADAEDSDTLAPSRPQRVVRSTRELVFHGEARFRVPDDGVCPSPRRDLPSQANSVDQARGSTRSNDDATLSAAMSTDEGSSMSSDVVGRRMSFAGSLEEVEEEEPDAASTRRRTSSFGAAV
jgi:hypothetical protein